MKSYLDEKLRSMTVSVDLRRNIINAAEKKQDSRPRIFTGRGAALAAAFCLMAMTTMTVFAAVVPGVNNMVYSFSPELAEKLYPVNALDEDKGIKVSVLYAANDSHYAAVYFSVQDTEMLGRVDERLDLMDSYQIDGPFASGIQRISYDKDTQTAYFLMEGSGAEELSGKMNSFRIRSIMCNKRRFELYDTNIDLNEIYNKEAEKQSLEDFVYTGGGSAEFAPIGQDVLEPDVLNISLGEEVDFVTITNMGFVDGYFHIQTKWSPSFDNHGQLKLLASESLPGSVNGERAEADSFNQSFRTKEDEALCGKDIFAKHIEYIYNISTPEELKNYELWAELVEDGVQIKGSWKVDFRLEDSESILIEDSLEHAEGLEVTELGFYITGYKGDKENCSFGLTLKDGTVLDILEYNSITRSRGEQDGVFSGVFETPIRLDQVSSVILDGEKVYQAEQ